MPHYTIGVDYGSLSGRAVLIDADNGGEIASSVFEYPHAVMSEALPDGTKLGKDWALQHPKDYLDVLFNTIPAVLKQSGINPADVTGIGTDFTACTILPVKKDGTPLCFLPEFEHNPHAYVKLWKHHAAQPQANRLNALAREMCPERLDVYGGKISSEWAIPKLMQIADEAPEIYAAMDRFVEAADWIIWQLCGKPSANACTAGYKAMYSKKDGYPGKDFFKALNPLMENAAGDKLSDDISPLGMTVGGLTPEMAEKTGLCAGTAVAVGNVDAHVCVPAVGIDAAGKMLAIMGTSTCHILLGTEAHTVPGMCGMVEDGVYPGFYGYEAGQSCVGDHFAWFTDNCLPKEYFDAAENAGMNIHRYLREKAEKLRPGESGLLALDWWNGNRSVLVDADLTGLMLGMTLRTRPEEMYRALIEATAYGTRKIVETFRENGVPVDEFVASGGISQKDPMTMQIYADVLKMPVKIADSLQGPALGSAIFAAVASGLYPDILTAARKLGRIKDVVYTPIAENSAIYDKLFAEYDRLHDLFGRGGNDVMKRLKAISEEQSAKN